LQVAVDINLSPTSYLSKPEGTVRARRFEILEIWRKLVLVSLLAAVAEGSLAFLVAGFLVSLFMLLVFVECKPYVEPQVDRVQMSSLLVTCLTFFYGLALELPLGLKQQDPTERTVLVR